MLLRWTLFFFSALDSVYFFYSKTTSVSSEMRFEIHRITFDHSIRKTHARAKDKTGKVRLFVKPMQAGWDRATPQAFSASATKSAGQLKGRPAKRGAGNGNG